MERREISSGSVSLSWEGSRATLFLGAVESSCVDVKYPERLEFEYMQHIDVEDFNRYLDSDMRGVLVDIQDEKDGERVYIAIE